MNLVHSIGARIPAPVAHVCSNYVKPVAERLLTKKVIFIAVVAFALYKVVSFARRATGEFRNLQGALQQTVRSAELQRKQKLEAQQEQALQGICQEVLDSDEAALIARLQSPLRITFNERDMDVSIIYLLALGQRVEVGKAPSEALKKAVYKAFFEAKGSEQVAVIADPNPNSSFRKASPATIQEAQKQLFAVLPKFTLNMPLKPSIMENEALRDFFMGALELECNKEGLNIMQALYSEYSQVVAGSVAKTTDEAKQARCAQKLNKLCEEFQLLCTDTDALAGKYPQACQVLRGAYSALTSTLTDLSGEDKTLYGGAPLD